jgi:hypothetical protein
MIEKLPERGLPPMQPGELSARRFCRRSIGPRRRSAQDGDRQDARCLASDALRHHRRKESTASFGLDPKKPPKSGWRTFDAMSEKERHQAALSDPNSPPATKTQLARARRVPSVHTLRKKLI